MRLITSIALTTITFAGSAWALTPMGPPTAQLKSGQVGFAATYGYSENDIVISNRGAKLTYDDFELQTQLATISWGLATERAEVFARLGTSSIEIEDQADDFRSGIEFAGGIGARITTNLGNALSWGVLGQCTWYQGEDDWVVLGDAGNAEIDAYEIQVAAGPCWKSENLCIYGGPFAHIVEGDLDLDVAGVTRSYDIDEDSGFGGYVGLTAKLRPELSAIAEFQITADAYLITAGVTLTVE